jgi:superfamily I DNA/RNA helicase
VSDTRVLSPAAALDAGSLDPEQAEALAYPCDGGLLAVGGGPGSGKTAVLVRRALALSAARPGASVWLCAPSDAGVARLRARLGEHESVGGVRCDGFGAVACEVLAAATGETTLELIGDVRAAQLFEDAGAELFSLEWAELANAEVDPEITGLQAPRRFAAAAYRLIRKLRGALISPDEFRRQGLRGATSFYGRPPNLAGADLLMETPPKYRDSLRASADELAAQHTREVDLVRILSRLYASYLEALVARGCLTENDAIYEAIVLVRARPQLAAWARARFAAALVDDAQDLGPNHVAFLEALFGERLAGVTIAGDARQATRTFAGARGEATFKRAAERVTLQARHRVPPAIEAVAERGLDPASSLCAEAVSLDPEAVAFYRGASLEDEASFVAATIRTLLDGGEAPSRIGVVTRNLRTAGPYVAALLARDVALDLAGEASLYAFPAVQDALAALWSLADPFRHDYLLRVLAAPWMRLSDASIATLCAEPATPQKPLFELPDEPPDESRARWDRRRDLRLGRNVTRGDADGELGAEACERVVALRAARERWERLERTLELPLLVRTILAETVLATLEPNARGRFARDLVERLLAEADAFADRDPLGSLAEFLIYAESVAEADSDLLSLSQRRFDCVSLLDVEAAKGREFDHVFTIDVRAGAWPQYYVPDAFLFTPSLGMIPKENVGESARAARTAKFTYALFRMKVRERFNAEERRAFYCAATRARRRLYVSASGRPTRGASTPEIFEELRAAYR